MTTRKQLAVQRILYLFGAGATHAELINLYPKKVSDANFLEENSLLLADVSKRVCRDAKKDGDFPAEIHRLLSPAGLSNVELFIGLIEKNAIRSERTIDKLKNRIRRDISERITAPRLKLFYLHKSLLELHQRIGNEQLLGIISLNYDRVLDEAYENILGKKPNYCLTSQGSQAPIPLLKLHGGFDLKYRNRSLPILTPGINKNYLELPYSFVWGRALELLIDCDILRVIGCSLSENDLGLVDLFFKAHLAQQKPFLLQIIDFDPEDNRVKEHFGFLPNIQTALEIEGGLISDQTIKDPTKGSNPFKIWLRAKIERSMKKNEIKRTKYVKKVLE